MRAQLFSNRNIMIGVGAVAAEGIGCAMLLLYYFLYSISHVLPDRLGAIFGATLGAHSVLLLPALIAVLQASVMYMWIKRTRSNTLQSVVMFLFAILIHIMVCIVLVICNAELGIRFAWMMIMRAYLISGLSLISWIGIMYIRPPKKWR